MKVEIGWTAENSDAWFYLKLSIDEPRLLLVGVYMGVFLADAFLELDLEFYLESKTTVF